MAKKKFVLKGKHGKLKIKIMEEKIFDNYVKEYFEKFSFIPRDGIAYKMFFTIIVLAENPNNNVFARIESSVNGDKTFLGSFSINERSKAIDESIQTMIIKIEQNIEDEISKKFKDFLTNKYYLIKKVIWNKLGNEISKRNKISIWIKLNYNSRYM